jgi:hypothetical protein
MSDSASTSSSLPFVIPGMSSSFEDLKLPLVWGWCDETRSKPAAG